MRFLFRGLFGLLVVPGVALVLGGCDLFGEDDSGSSSMMNEQFEDIRGSQTVIDSAGNRYTVGYIQVSSNRQDPFVQKLDADGTQIWGIRHDTTPRDSRGIAVAIGPDNTPFVLFSTDGGSNESGDRFRDRWVTEAPFSGAPFGSYGSGGGGKVSIVARLDSETGRITHATYLIARLDGGNTNSFQPRAIAVVGSQVLVEANSAAWPPAAGARQNAWVRFDEDLFNNDTRAGGNDLFRVILPLELSELSEVIWLDNR